MTERPNISRIKAMAALLQARSKRCQKATAGCSDAVATQELVHVTGTNLTAEKMQSCETEQWAPLDHTR